MCFKFIGRGEKMGERLFSWDCRVRNGSKRNEKRPGKGKKIIQNRKAAQKRVTLGSTLFRVGRVREPAAEGMGCFEK